MDIEITVDNYDQVYKQFKGLIERNVFKYAYGEELREDLRQESRLALLDAIRYYMAHEGFEFAPLLQCFIARKIKNELRRKYKLLSGLSKGDLYDSDKIVPLDTDTIEQVIASQDDIGEIENRIFCDSMLDILPDKDQKMMRLIYYEGMSFSEVGRIHGVTKQRISEKHKKILKKIKAKFEPSS